MRAVCRIQREHSLQAELDKVAWAAMAMFPMVGEYSHYRKGSEIPVMWLLDLQNRYWPIVDEMFPEEQQLRADFRLAAARKVTALCR